MLSKEFHKKIKQNQLEKFQFNLMELIVLKIQNLKKKENLQNLNSQIEKTHLKERNLMKKKFLRDKSSKITLKNNFQEN